MFTVPCNVTGRFEPNTQVLHTGKAYWSDRSSPCSRTPSRGRGFRGAVAGRAWGLLAFLLLGLSAATQAAEQVVEHARAAEHEALSLRAIDIGEVFGLPISNSMLAAWLVAALLILFAQIAVQTVREVPEGAQNFWEWLVEGLYSFLEGIIGHDLVKKTFWLFASIFIFIVTSNWLSLVPGVGTIGWGSHGAHGFSVARPLLRGNDADLNMTFAMAAFFFLCWLYWAVQANGIGGFLAHLFAPKGNPTGMLKVVLWVVFIAVGFLEIISILFRPISLSLRLFGNTYAGETMLEVLANIVPSLGWLIPVPFYFMEILVAVVQAMVFMLLTAVFTMLICQHEEHAGVSAH